MPAMPLILQHRGKGHADFSKNRAEISLDLETDICQSKKKTMQHVSAFQAAHLRVAEAQYEKNIGKGGPSLLAGTSSRPFQGCVGSHVCA